MFKRKRENEPFQISESLFSRTQGTSSIILNGIRIFWWKFLINSSRNPDKICFKVVSSVKSKSRRAKQIGGLLLVYSSDKSRLQVDNKYSVTVLSPKFTISHEFFNENLDSMGDNWANKYNTCARRATEITLDAEKTDFVEILSHWNNPRPRHSTYN